MARTVEQILAAQIAAMTLAHAALTAALEAEREKSAKLEQALAKKES